MTDFLRKLIDDFIAQVEGINEKRQEYCHKDLQHCMQETKAFNLLRQNLAQYDRHELTEEITNLNANVHILKNIVDKQDDQIEKLTKSTDGKNAVSKN